MAQVKITQLRSSARCIQDQIRTLHALGLRRIRHSVVHKKSPTLDGMIRVVAHLVKVEEVK
ncbi:MAG TPA: 50S ribosomal protein L30 [Fibrobacteres bacterium]|jgi:large subunit ribosomal protein L30|nr:50S ribosomal protein L30 [Fibrobacterota bacterium]